MSFLWGRVYFSKDGEQRASSWVHELRTNLNVAAEAALMHYQREVPYFAQPQGAAQGSSISAGFRNVMVGHPTEAERPSLSSYLSRAGMGEVRNVGDLITWALYGKVSILDSLNAMYWRRDWGGTGNPRYADTLIVQKQPIWELVEYGAGRHTISPRPDRKVLRFMWRGEIIFRKATSHPGAMRGGAGRLTGPVGGGWAAHALRRMSINAASQISSEPYGRAPFRTAQFRIMQRIDNLVAQILPRI